MELGQPATTLITPEAADAMREAIAGAGGREVFFAGTLDEAGAVCSVSVCARGSEGAVPGYVESARSGDVVIHNHPTGGIGPSEADLELSTLFAFHGLGVYITDNDVARVYVVVEPFRKKARRLLSVKEMARVLSPSGRLARLIPQFEVRPQQARMMEAVARAFNEDGVAVIEAPTGVGKTVAYLLPAVLWALHNKERVVVSTRTINLQEQIIHKDVPVLAQCIDKPFSAVLVKGRSNYLCHRKLERALSEATLFEDDPQQQELKRLGEWAEHTADGTLSDLPFVPGRELWEQVCSEADTCHFANCPAQKKCFVAKARREVTKADLLVVNHHMLFADLAIKRETGSFSSLGVLPAYRRVIFDEAHSIEDSATEYFGAEATRAGALRLIGLFARQERRQERGLLPYIKLKLIKEVAAKTRDRLDPMLDLIDNELLPGLAAAREALVVYFDALRSLAAEKCGGIGRDIKWRLTPEVLRDPELRELHNVYALPAESELRACAGLCTTLHQKLRAIDLPTEGEEAPLLSEMVQLGGFRERLQRLANVLAEGTSAELQANTVRWIEIDAQNKNTVRVIRCPLHVGEELAEWVYGNLSAVAMTSATLSVRHSFDYLSTRIGLDRINGREVEPVALDSPFDFQSQALLCIATDLPAPDERSFLDASVATIHRTLRITRGHAFVLFTSFYALDYTFRRLEGELRAAGITPLKQGMSARTQLLDRFRSDTSSVLFATDSFWEGVDVAGDALQCVILPKLPFRVPTEPVLEARAEAIDTAGGNSFLEFTVPQAVIKFRQGFGRLIRRKTDRGAVVVLDRRIVTKYYGRIFLESLPEMRRIKGPQQEICEALERFFKPSEEQP